MSNESDAADFTRIDSSADQYELIAEIAHGGMATVFVGRLVRSHGFTRPVAIKRMHRHLAAESAFRAMFVDETLLVAKIRHPNVVPMLDIVARDAELLAVMELVDGAPLTDVAKNHGRALPPRIATAIIHDVLCGLHAAHELRGDDGERLEVIHRDVSPSNILVGADGLTRILDFGIAKALGRIGSTLTGTVKGKTRYMAPEQLVASPILGPSADVFAAGVVLWEMLTGRRLFTAARGFGGGTEDRRLEPPSAFSAEAAPLDEVVMRALEGDAAERFGSALEMARAIEDALRPAGRLDVADFIAALPLPSRDRVRKLVSDLDSTPEHVECSLASDRTRTRVRTFFPTDFFVDAEAGSQTTTRELAARWILPRLSQKNRVALGVSTLFICALVSVNAFSSEKRSPAQRPESPSSPVVLAVSPPTAPPAAWTPVLVADGATKTNVAASKSPLDPKARRRAVGRTPRDPSGKRDDEVEDILRSALGTSARRERDHVRDPLPRALYEKFQ